MTERAEVDPRRCAGEEKVMEPDALAGPAPTQGAPGRHLALPLGLCAVLLASLLPAMLPLDRANALSEVRKTIDETYSCPVGKRAGVRNVEVHAIAGTRSSDDPTKWQTRAATYVIDPTLPRAGLAWSFAGWPQVWQPAQVPSARAVWVSTSCHLVLADPTPLSTRGLTGGSASPFGDEYECAVPKRVLIRIRATFRAPTTLRRTALYLEADGIVTRAQIAVRTASGTPVSYATVSESGRARLFVAGTCIPD